MKNLLFALVLLLICGCSRDYFNIPGSKPMEETIQLDEGQKVQCVEWDNFKTWLQEHKAIHIDSVAAIDSGNHGHTTAFLVVYKEK